MKKNTRIKATPIQNRAEFLALIAEIATLEAEARALAAARDIELAEVTKRHQLAIAPLTEKLKGKLALVEAYADEHRKELLAKDAKSAKTQLATFGWRTGNRKVELIGRTTIEQAVNALRALDLGAYIRMKPEIAKDAILVDSKDDQHLHAVVKDPCGEPVMQDGQLLTKAVPLASAGLKITQEEAFFIDPVSEDANAVKAEAAA